MEATRLSQLSVLCREWLAGNVKPLERAAALKDTLALLENVKTVLNRLQFLNRLRRN